MTLFCRISIYIKNLFFSVSVIIHYITFFSACIWRTVNIFCTIVNVFFFYILHILYMYDNKNAIVCFSDNRIFPFLTRLFFLIPYGQICPSTPDTISNKSCIFLHRPEHFPCLEEFALLLWRSLPPPQSLVFLTFMPFPFAASRQSRSANVTPSKTASVICFRVVFGRIPINVPRG